ncbi:MAG TPA: S8 family serine peptidase [Caulobacteraceae bacterium]|nr:S8 family serine peptidase [Caulobacteraceae bacterium]
MARLAKLIAVSVALVCAGQASAQLHLPGGVGAGLGGVLPNSPVGAVLPDVRDTLDRTAQDLSPRAIAQARLDRLQRLVRQFPKDLDLDETGDPVVRSEVLAISPTPAALDAAAKAGFTVARHEILSGVDVEVVTLKAPPKMTTRQAVRRLKRLDPAGAYDFNPLYFQSAKAISLAGAPSVGPVRLGLIDTGLDARHPALAGIEVQTQGFASDGYHAAAHGLAVASLTGVGKGGAVYSADVYGSGPAGGSAASIARALAWMVQVKAPVINVSLVGPANLIVQQAVAGVQKKGALVVAAVGNDGPAAPPAYPASYPGVIAVTAVDRRGKVLVEAGRALHLDFAAPGADISAAEGQGYGAVRGTSFAAPIVAGRLAALVRSGSADPVAGLASQARKPGREYGKGLIGAEMLTSVR